MMASVSPSMASGIPSAALPEPDIGAVKKIPQLTPNILQDDSEKLESISSDNHAEKFLLKGIIVTGNTVFTAEDLLKDSQTSLGSLVSILDCKKIANKITRKYRQNGFLFSKAFVPEQSLGDGIITIKIVEGYVLGVTLNDETQEIQHYDYMSVISGFQSMVVSMRPFNIDEMQKQLLSMNDNGMIDASVTFVPLENQNAPVGAVGLILSLKKRTSSQAISGDNYSSRYLGPNHIDVSYRTGNIATSWDQLSVNADSSVPSNKLVSISSEYSVPFWGGRGQGYIGLSLSNSSPQYTLAQLDVKGKNRKIKIGYLHTFVRSRQDLLQVNLELQANNSDADTLGSTLYKDRIRKISLGLKGAKFDLLQGLNEMSLSVSRGLNFFGAKGIGDSNISRSDGRADFTIANISYSRTQSLPRSLEVYAGLNMQYAASPLLASEEFGYGGVNIGRAFDPSEIVGDKGIIAFLDLKYKGLDPYMGVMLVPFAYFDFGKLWSYGGSQGALFASSAGFGMKIAYDESIEGIITLAFPLVGEQGAPRWGNGSSPRLLLGFSKKF